MPRQIHANLLDSWDAERKCETKSSGSGHSNSGRWTRCVCVTTRKEERGEGGWSENDNCQVWESNVLKFMNCYGSYSFCSCHSLYVNICVLFNTHVFDSMPILFAGYFCCCCFTRYLPIRVNSYEIRARIFRGFNRIAHSKYARSFVCAFYSLSLSVCLCFSKLRLP